MTNEYRISLTNVPVETIFYSKTAEPIIPNKSRFVLAFTDTNTTKCVTVSTVYDYRLDITETTISLSIGYCDQPDTVPGQSAQVQILHPVITDYLAYRTVLSIQFAVAIPRVSPDAYDPMEKWLLAYIKNSYGRVENAGMQYQLIEPGEIDPIMLIQGGNLCAVRGCLATYTNKTPQVAQDIHRIFEEWKTMVRKSYY